MTALALRSQAEWAEEEVLRGVRVVRAAPLARLHKGAISPAFVAAFRRLAGQADIIHLHLPMLEAALLARLAPPTAALVATYHCRPAHASGGGLLDRAAVAAARRSAQACCRRAASILVSSFDYAAAAPELDGSRSKWVEAFPPDQAPDDLAPRPPNPNPRVAGFLGRFVEEKGIHVILDAIPLVAARMPDARFLLAGDFQTVPGGSCMGELRQRLDALGARVQVLGKLPPERLFEFYRSLDLLLLPSVNSYEAFGIVQLEAMKAGVPVVASDLPGVRTPVTRTGAGTLVPPGDVPALAEAVLQWFAGAKSMAPEEIAQRAWRQFPAGAALQAVRTVYFDVLGRNGAVTGLRKQVISPYHK